MVDGGLWLLLGPCESDSCLATNMGGEVVRKLEAPAASECRSPIPAQLLVDLRTQVDAVFVIKQRL